MTLHIADFHISQYQGGAEMVDDTIRSRLHIDYLPSAMATVDKLHAHNRYLIGNALHLPEKTKQWFMEHHNYIIFEHDYKIHPSRQPNLFPDHIVPTAERTNYDWYKNAHMVLLQSNDHKTCFLENEVPGNLISLAGSIWSDAELDLLRKFSGRRDKLKKAAVIANPHPAKGTIEAIKHCIANDIDFDLIPRKPKEEFYETLSRYEILVYLPKVRESFCRLIVEAKTLGLTLGLCGYKHGVISDNWFWDTPAYKMPDKLQEYTHRNLGSIHRAMMELDG